MITGLPPPGQATPADLKRIGSLLGLSSVCLRLQDRLLPALRSRSLSGVPFAREEQYAQAKLQQVIQGAGPPSRRRVFVPGDLLQKAKPLVHPERRSQIETLTTSELQRLLLQGGCPPQLPKLVEKQGLDGKIIEISDANLEHMDDRQSVFWLKDLLTALSCHYEFLEQVPEFSEISPFLFSVRSSFRRSLAESFMERPPAARQQFLENGLGSSEFTGPEPIDELGSSTGGSEGMGESALGQSAMAESALAESSPGIEGSVYISEGEYSQFADQNSFSSFLFDIQNLAPSLPFDPFKKNRVAEIVLLYAGPDRVQKRVSAGVAGLSIGRTSENQVCFPEDLAVSSVHCLIIYEHQRKGFVLQDLGSKAGTFLRLYRGAPVRAGAEVHLSKAATLYFKEVQFFPEKKSASIEVLVQVLGESTNIVKVQLGEGREEFIGCGRECLVRVGSKEVKGRHAQVRGEAGRIVVEEKEGSTWLRLSARGQVSTSVDLWKGAQFRVHKNSFRVL